MDFPLAVRRLKANIASVMTFDSRGQLLGVTKHKTFWDLVSCSSCNN